MDSLILLTANLKEKKAVVGVVGLGYVGISLAAAFAGAGLHVHGIDTNEGRVDALGSGKLPLDGQEPELPELLSKVIGARELVVSTSYESLSASDVILVAVETPIDPHDHRPRYEALAAACASIGKAMKKGALVVVASTVSPGTTEGIVRRALEEASGTKANEGFYLGCAPERVMPGKLLANLRTLPRVCGGLTPETAQAMACLYGTIAQATIDTTDCTTAEVVKTAENAYRDVKIAFANELAKVCEIVGADFEDVRRLVDGSGPLVGMLTAGGGVGGQCIPKAPWLLLEGVANADAETDFEPRVLTAARAVNDAMPLHVARLVEDALKEAGQTLAGARIAVLGYAYRENSGNARGTPSDVLVGHLRDRGAEVEIHDPWVPAHTGDVYARTRGAHAAIVMVAHDAYQALDLEELKKALALPVLVDARHVVATADARRLGFVFRAVGRGKISPARA